MLCNAVNFKTSFAHSPFACRLYLDGIVNIGSSFVNTDGYFTCTCGGETNLSLAIR